MKLIPIGKRQNADLLKKDILLNEAGYEVKETIEEQEFLISMKGRHYIASAFLSNLELIFEINGDPYPMEDLTSIWLISE